MYTPQFDGVHVLGAVLKTHVQRSQVRRFDSDNSCYAIDLKIIRCSYRRIYKFRGIIPHFVFTMSQRNGLQDNRLSTCVSAKRGDVMRLHTEVVYIWSANTTRISQKSGRSCEL